MTANCHFPVSSAEKLLKIAFKQEDLQAVCLLYETCVIHTVGTDTQYCLTILIFWSYSMLGLNFYCNSLEWHCLVLKDINQDYELVCCEHACI